MKVETVTKSAMSFKGWNVKELLIGNFKTIKELFKVGIPLIISIIAADNLALQGLITLGGKLILDSLEYWVKKKQVIIKG